MMMMIMQHRCRTFVVSCVISVVNDFFMTTLHLEDHSLKNGKHLLKRVKNIYLLFWNYYYFGKTVYLTLNGPFM